MHTAGDSATERQYYIDALRVIAVILLIVFHTAMVFNPWTFHIKNAETSDVFAILNEFIYTWHMPLFMLLAGASVWFALAKRSRQQFVTERIKRILLPFVFGILLVIPPQTYYERVQQGAFTGSFLEFYPTFFNTGLYPQGNFTYNHLWFLAYLFIFSLVLLPLFGYLRGESGGAVLDWVARFLQKPGRLLFVFPLPLVVAHTALLARWPHNNVIFDDWAHMAWLLILFLYGFVLVSDARNGAAIDRAWKTALALGAAGFILRVIAGVSGLETPMDYGAPLYYLDTIVWTLMTWFWLVALLGFGRRYLNRPSTFLKYAGEIAYPYYILHQTVIIFLAYYVVQTDWSLIIKFSFISLASFFLTAALCEAVKLTGVTRFIFGMKLA